MARSPKPISKSPAATTKAKHVVEERLHLLAKKPSTREHLRYRFFQEYLRDARERGIDYIYHNVLDDDGLPLFPKYISWRTAQDWSAKDNWPTRRQELLAKIEAEILEHLQDQFLQQRIAEIRTLTVIGSALSEHLAPKIDKRTGEIVRYGIDHPLEGLPVLNHEVKGGYTKLLEAFLRLDERLGAKRGDAGNLIKGVVADASGESLEAPQDQLQTETAVSPEQQLMRRMNVDPSDIRQLAHSIISKGSPSPAPRVEVVDDGDDDDSI